jgi:hypothetical protein
MKTIFQVGDKVFDYKYGWGVVHKINQKEDCPVCVEYQYQFASYLNEGCENIDVLKPSLSFTEYTLKGFSQERPETLPERGDVVWVRDCESEEWDVCYFVEKQDNCFLVSFDDPFDDEGDTICYKFLTTVNPYKK